MTTQQVADRMNVLFKENKWNVIQDEFYAEDCKSIEPEKSVGLKTVHGLAAIKEKGRQFGEMVEEMHSGFVSDLVVGGNFISCAMGMDVTMKGMGRMQMDEIAVYEVKDGKIISEQFFF